MTKKKKPKSLISILKPKLKKGLQNLKHTSFKQKALLFLAFVAIILVGVGLYASNQQRTVDTEASTPPVQCSAKASACDIELMAQCLYGQDLVTEQITGCVETTLDINEDGRFNEADFALCKTCTSVPGYCDSTNNSCETSQVRQCAAAAKDMFCDATRNQCVYGFNPDLGCDTDQDCIDTDRGDTCIDKGLEENVCTYKDGPPQNQGPEYTQMITDVSCQTDTDCTQNLDISLCNGTEDINNDGKVDSFDEIACRVCQDSGSPSSPTPTNIVDPSPQVCNEQCNTNQACESACGADFKCSNDCDEGKRCPAVMGNCVPKEEPRDCVPLGEKPEGIVGLDNEQCCDGLVEYYEPQELAGVRGTCVPEEYTCSPNNQMYRSCDSNADCSSCGSNFECVRSPDSPNNKICRSNKLHQYIPGLCIQQCHFDGECETACGSLFSCSNEGLCEIREEQQECVPEGESLGPVTQGNTKQCCPGLVPGGIEPGIVGHRGYCLKPEPSTPPSCDGMLICKSDQECASSCGSEYACQFGVSYCQENEPCPTSETGFCFKKDTTCPLKSQGDANCDGDISLTDFNEWRVEFRALVNEEPDTHTKDADGDGNKWDANFDGKENANTKYPSDLTDFSIWRDTYVNSLLNDNTTDDLDENFISWSEALSLLNNDKVELVGQSHSLDVYLSLTDGTNLVTKEPYIDAIVDEIEKCGEVCKNMPINSE